ncbi:unnamed protein product [Closterium sp. NIES-53]
MARLGGARAPSPLLLLFLATLLPLLAAPAASVVVSAAASWNGGGDDGVASELPPAAWTIGSHATGLVTGGPRMALEEGEGDAADGWALGDDEAQRRRRRMWKGGLLWRTVRETRKAVRWMVRRMGMRRRRRLTIFRCPGSFRRRRKRRGRRARRRKGLSFHASWRTRRKRRRPMRRRRRRRRRRKRRSRGF